MLSLSLKIRCYVFALLCLLLTGFSHAESIPFDAAAFAEARQQGKPVLVEVGAEWCTTCRVQQPIVNALVQQPEFAEFVVFRVDFDRQKDVLQELGVRMQSTLIVYRGEEEVSRSIAQTNRQAIAQQLSKAL
ncbi:thioredoxin family protein [Nitrincola alkalilacustris]|uniref:thioredoxin family protein n=1 Tax=Nitrincola alkalilacustris TaxID=1571224 RepID=UPI00124DF191|nr:thioredoxin family protein [Nitrincola alkalilacustris]